MVMALWVSVGVRPKWGAYEATEPPPKSARRDPPRPKFAAPTEQEAAEHHREKGYHFDLLGWFNYYASQAWKKANGQPVSDWRRLMGTFEQKWKAEPRPQAMASPGIGVKPPPMVNAVEIKRRQEREAREKGEIE